ncbi:MAG: Lrp/AsnC ligand binding domain-containing protein [Halobacteria archaeon]
MSSLSTEQKILEQLEKDAKASYGEIADAVGVSKPTVRKYIEKLEDEGTILGYSAEVDPKKLGGRTVSLVGVNAESDKFLRVVDEVKKMPEVQRLYISSGDHDLMAEVFTEDNSALHSIISEEISEIEGVEAVHPSVLQERVK